LAYPAYLKEKARELRSSKNLTIDEIAERLAISRTTAYYWVGSIEIDRTTRQTLAQRRATRAMQVRFRRLREDAYEEGSREFEALARDPTFRDFVCLYIAEGYKRSRNTVSICNSDPAVMRLGHRWIQRFGQNPLEYRI
jgi:AcrR family transcriptional regulator